MSQDDKSDNEKRLDVARQFWNDAAASFDDESDHGLRDPVVRAAWTAFLREALSSGKGSILDVGCGTGSLSIILARLGFDVTGIDLSPAMLGLAEKKAQIAGCRISFQVMDAAFPQLSPQQFDALVCRHLLWTLPDLPDVLRHWIRLLKPGGRLLLIEGYWSTDVGLHAQEILDALPASLTHIVVQHLSHQADLWDREVSDERYAILADLES